MPHIGLGRRTIMDGSFMMSVRKPVFVDNAVHLGETASSSSSTKQVTIKQRKRAHYAVATERAYHIEELEDSLIIKQPQIHGRNYQGNIIYLDDLITNDAASNKPPLLFAKNNPANRLSISNVQTSTEGTKFAIKNMKGQDLLGIGFDPELVLNSKTSAHFGQIIDVGLRTTDLALRLSRDISDTLTSVNIALPMTANNSEFDRRRHSNKFLGQDFYGINLISALRFVSRHDSRIVHFDRYGNLLYVPFDFEEAGRYVDPNKRTGSVINKSVDNISNKVIVVGVPRSLNELSYAEVNSSEKQVDGDVLEEGNAVTDFTVKNNQQAREVARNILKANAIMKGSKTSNGHPKAWDLRPGTIIEYDGIRYILTEVRHRLSKDEADLTLLAVDTGIEGVLQGIMSGTLSSGNLPDIIEQIKEENIVLFGNLELASCIYTHVTGHGIAGNGMIIGKAMARGTIGGTSSQETVGGSKTRTITYRGDI